MRRLLVAAVLALTLAGSVPAGSGPAGPTPHLGHGRFVPPAPQPLRTGERFVTLTLPRPYTPVAPDGATDEYRCFLMDPALTAPAYLTGSQFLPENADIVHHAILFRVGPGEVAAARRADERSAGQGWRCFGDAGIAGGPGGEAGGPDWVGHWAPGANEVLLAAGLGHELPPGSRLVVQVHYNLLTTRRSSDRSGVRLRLAGGGTPVTTRLLTAPVELPCAAGERGRLCDRTEAVRDVARRFGRASGGVASALIRECGNGRLLPGPTQHCDRPAGRAGTVHAAAGHMHLLGRAMRIEINPETPDAVTVLDVPAYDFDDQAIRPLAEPVQIMPRDVLRVTCTHDTGLRARLPQLRKLPPRYVVWGEGTADEMCLGLLIGTWS